MFQSSALIETTINQIIYDESPIVVTDSVGHSRSFTTIAYNLHTREQRSSADTQGIGIIQGGGFQ